MDAIGGKSSVILGRGRDAGHCRRHGVAGVMAQPFLPEDLTRVPEQGLA